MTFRPTHMISLDNWCDQAQMIPVNNKDVFIYDGLNLRSCATGETVMTFFDELLPDFYTLGEPIQIIHSKSEYILVSRFSRRARHYIERWNIDKKKGYVPAEIVFWVHSKNYILEPDKEVIHTLVKGRVESWSIKTGKRIWADSRTTSVSFALNGGVCGGLRKLDRDGRVYVFISSNIYGSSKGYQSYYHPHHRLVSGGGWGWLIIDRMNVEGTDFDPRKGPRVKYRGIREAVFTPDHKHVIAIDLQGLLVLDVEDYRPTWFNTLKPPIVHKLDWDWSVDKTAKLDIVGNWLVVRYKNEVQMFPWELLTLSDKESKYYYISVFSELEDKGQGVNLDGESIDLICEYAMWE